MVTPPDVPAMAERLLARLPGSPDVLLHQVDAVQGTVLLLDFNRARYRAASFLDDRVLVPGVQGTWVPAGEVSAALRRSTAARPLHFIFHAGHVGSTLLSRLLDEVDGVLGLREPVALRTFADAADTRGRADALLAPAQLDGLLGTLVTAWQRGYADTQAVVLKATSSASRVGVPLLTALPAARAITLNLDAEPYLATLLAGANAPLDLRGHGPERMRRLLGYTQAIDRPLYALSLGEQAALAWLVETATLQALQAAAPARVLAVDFGGLLADLPGTLARVLAHLGLDTAQAGRLAASPVLTQYAKSPEHAYSPALRAQLLDAARRDHGDEIRRGLAWLARLAQADARIAAVVAAAARRQAGG